MTGFHVLTSVPAPPMVADAGPSIAVVLRVVKWFTASVAVLWQYLHVVELVPKSLRWRVCSPEL